MVPQLVHQPGGNGHLAGIDAQHRGQGVHVAVVGEVLAAGEVVPAPERRRPAHQHPQGPGLIVHVAHLAERGAVTRDQDGPAGQEPGHHSLLPVGDDVAWSEDHRQGDDGGGEPAPAVGRQQQILAEQLVQAVFALLGTAVDGVILGDRQDVGGRVDDRRGDEHIVPDPPVEQLDHDFDVLWVVGAHIVHAVEILAGENLTQPAVIGTVGNQPAHPIREVARRFGRD